jgi:energy-coupling factor transporter transmembrane protein EcfT
MSNVFSTPRNRTITLVLLLASVVLAVAATSMGIDDNPPGILLAFLAGIALVLAFTHPWRTPGKFLFLLLAAVLGFIVFILLNILTDAITKNPAASDALRNLLQSPAYDALGVILAMVCAAAFLVGVVGAVVMFIRSRHQPA